MKKKFPWSIKIFNIFGIPLELHVTFLLFMGAIACLGWVEKELEGAIWWSVWVLLMFVCVILHELGHCHFARRYGIPIHKILVLPIGGMAQFGKIPREPSREIKMTIAGPCVNFFLAIVLLSYLHLSAPSPQTIKETISIYKEDIFQYELVHIPWLLFWFNILMGTFNLIPIFPMDGGRLLRATLALKLDYQKATKVSVWIAKPLAIAGICFAISMTKPLLLALFIFIFFAGEMEYRAVSQLESARGLTIGDVARRSFISLSENNTVADAMDIFSEHPHDEILILDDHHLSGLLGSQDILAHTGENKYDVQLKNISLQIPIGLQAHAPLELFITQLLNSRYPVHPVFENDNLIGVIDKRALTETVYWKKLIKNATEDLTQANAGKV